MTLTCVRQPCIGTGLILLLEPYMIKKKKKKRYRKITISSSSHLYLNGDK